MPDEMNFNLLSLDDVMNLEEVRVYFYDEDVILTSANGVLEHLIHLFENEVDGVVMYGINKGRPVELGKTPLFIGQPFSIEVRRSKGNADWDFCSLVLRGSDNAWLRVHRNDLSFPEPTFVLASQESTAYISNSEKGRASA